MGNSTAIPRVSRCLPLIFNPELPPEFPRHFRKAAFLAQAYPAECWKASDLPGFFGPPISLTVS